MTGNVPAGGTRELAEHLATRLGPVGRTVIAGGYRLSFHEVAEPPITTVVTEGLRRQPLTAMLPEELVCSLWTPQRSVAHYLVDSLAESMIRARRGVEYGAIFQRPRPVINDIDIVGTIAHVSPIHDEAFNLYPSPEAPEVQLITLVPITAAEAEFARAEGGDALFEVFSLNRTNILDVRRRSAV